MLIDKNLDFLSVIYYLTKLSERLSLRMMDDFGDEESEEEAEEESEMRGVIDSSFGFSLMSKIGLNLVFVDD